MQLSNAIDEFVIARNDLAPVTLSDYERYLRLWLEHAGNLDLEDVTLQDLQAFMTWMRDEYRTKFDRPLSQAGLANCWTSLRSFWRWLGDSRLELDNVSEGLKSPRVPEPTVAPFTKDEVQALIEACYKSALADTKAGRRAFRYERHEAYRDVAIVFTLLDTGVRVGELHRLNVGDIDLRGRSLEVRPHRSGRKSRGRILPFSRDTQACILRWFSQRKESDDEVLTRSGDLPDDAPAWISLGGRYPGRRLGRSAIQHMIRRLAERAGVDEAYPHKFRHTFAIEYLRNGGDPWTLQKLLGHSSMEMVRRYLALSKQDMREAHSRASAVSNWRLYIPK